MPVTTIKNVIKTAGAISYWEENGEAFTVKRNSAGRPLYISSVRGSTSAQRCDFKYNETTNEFTGLIGSIDTSMLSSLIADANGAVTSSVNLTGGIEIHGLQLIPGIVLNSTAAAAANTAAINKAISLGGDFSLTHSGAIYIASAITMTSNTSLYLGANTIVRSIDAVTAFACVENVHYTAAPDFTLGAGELTFAGQTATLAHTGVGAVFPVGSYIAVLDSSTVGWCGVFGPIQASSANSVSWLMENVPAATPALGTIKVAVADYNIKLWGPGTLDPNRQGQLGASGQGGLKGRGTRWYKVAHLTCDDYTCLAAGMWTNAICCYLDFKTHGVRALPGNYPASDGWNIASPGRRARVNNLTYVGGDNAVGLFALGLGATETVLTHPTMCGERYDTVIDGVDAIVTGNTNIIALWGDSTSSHGDVEIRHVRGVSGAGAFGAATYALDGCNWNANGGDSLLIEDIDVTIPAANAAVSMASGGNWGAIHVSGIRHRNGGSAVFILKDSACTVGKLTVEKIASITSYSSVPISVVGGLNVDVLTYRELQDITTGTTAARVVSTQATVGVCNIENMLMTHAGPGAQVCHGIYPVGVVNIRNVVGTGSGSNGELFQQDNQAAATVGIINIEACKAINAAGLVGLNNASQATAVTVNLANSSIDSCTTAVMAYAPADVTLSGYSDKTWLNVSPVVCNTSGKAYSVKAVNSKTIKPVMASIAAGALLRVSGGTDMKLDGDKFTGTPVAGDSFWNTNASSTFGTGTSKIGLYGYTGAAWTKVFGPA